MRDSHSFFFFSSRRRHTRSKRDWSSDVCSSDLYSSLSYLVYFQDIDGKAPQITQTRVTGAEIIDGQPDSQRLDGPQGRSEERRVGKGGGGRRWRHDDRRRRVSGPEGERGRGGAA